MPTYEYKCKNCGNYFDFFQSMKDAPLKVCPACNKETLKRLLGTGAGIIFKGSGFYQTDYRSESYKKGAEKEKKDDSSKTSSGKTEKNKKKSTETKKN
ncbi:MAG: zinc ribbon domain-containing protein [Victivallales bacterium]|nr:zinc ribbon domain-containing protein [Victivallales bacterium]